MKSKSKAATKKKATEAAAATRKETKNKQWTKETMAKDTANKVELVDTCNNERAFFAHHTLLPITIMKIRRGRHMKATFFGVYYKDAGRAEVLSRALITAKDTGANRFDINGMSCYFLFAYQPLLCEEVSVDSYIGALCKSNLRNHKNHNNVSLRSLYDRTKDRPSSHHHSARPRITA